MTDKPNATLTEIEEWLEHFRESANPSTALERWLYLDTAATYGKHYPAACGAWSADAADRGV